jgi:hypothetical protein
MAAASDGQTPLYASSAMAFMAAQAWLMLSATISECHTAHLALLARVGVTFIGGEQGRGRDSNSAKLFKKEKKKNQIKPAPPLAKTNGKADRNMGWQKNAGQKNAMRSLQAGLTGPAIFLPPPDFFCHRYCCPRISLPVFLSAIFLASVRHLRPGHSRVGVTIIGGGKRRGRKSIAAIFSTWTKRERN